MVSCVFLMILVYSSFFKTSEGQKDCVWDKDDASKFPSKNPPLLFDYNDKTIVLPVEDHNKRLISVSSGRGLAISCPGLIDETNSRNDFTMIPFVQHILVECDNGDLKNKKTKQVINMKDMGCRGIIKGLSKPTHPSKTCGTHGTLLEIGFASIDSMKQEDFYQQIKVCFDKDSRETTIWTEHTVYGKNIKARGNVPPPPDQGAADSKRKRIDFSSHISPFTPPIEKIYKIAAQKKHASFGKDIVYPGAKYFARGHLAPAADFVTQAEMDSSFQFINCVPQWQQINNGNWKHIERKIRDLADYRKHDMLIITGGYGILKIATKEQYLGGTKVPIPAATWKIVIDKSTLEGAAFVVSNDPWSTISHDAVSTASMKYCSEMTWLDPMGLHTDKEKGHTYCFSIVDFMKKYPTIKNELPQYNYPKDVILKK